MEGRKLSLYNKQFRGHWLSDALTIAITLIIKLQVELVEMMQVLDGT
jgi:hypothetical protein